MTSFPESSPPVAPPKGVSRVTLEEVATFEGVEGKVEMACSESMDPTGGVMWFEGREEAVGVGG